MVKNSISSYLLLIVLLAICASGYAQSFTYCGYDYSVNKDGVSATLMSGSSQESGTVIVPDYAYDANGKAYAVTAIEHGAFSGFKESTVIIGDNVVTIGKGAFPKFGEKGDGTVLILGKSVSNIEDKAFEKIGKTSTGNKVFLKCDKIPSLDGKDVFKTCYNTTFYVRDYNTKELYMQNDKWVKVSKQKNNKFTYPFPYEYEFESGKWLTAVFPISMSEHTVLSNFGQGTIVAYLKSAKYDKEAKEYQLHFEYTNAIEANTPYLIKIGNSTSDFVSDTEGDPNAATLTKSVSIENKSGYEAQMIGVYSQYTLSKNEFYLRNKDGKLFFYLATGDDGSFVGANKCYFKILDQNGNLVPAKFSCYFDNSGEATAIRSIPSMWAGCLKKGVFNLSGQYVGDDSTKLTTGIYIVNGKKRVIQ